MGLLEYFILEIKSSLADKLEDPGVCSGGAGGVLYQLKDDATIMGLVTAHSAKHKIKDMI